MSHLFQTIKKILYTTIKTLVTLEQSGYLAPQVWGTLLIISIAVLIILAQSRILASSAEIDSSDVDISSSAENFHLLNASTPMPGALPLKSAPTAAALYLMELTPLPTPTLPFILHVVQEKETLISIASLYNVTTEAILAANDIRDPTALEIGQSLLIPPQEGLRRPVILHELQPDEDLLSIAAKYGSSLKDILAANPLLDPEAFPVGETIIVPIIFDQPKPAQPAENTDEPIHYTIQTGDIPLTIANQFDVPVEFLLASNEITDSTRLQVGQDIIIPPYEGEAYSFPVILHELVEGNTLLDIAIRYGSSVKDILAVNPDLIPSDLKPGEIVAVPIVFSQPKPTPIPDEIEAAPPVPIESSGLLVDLQQEMLAAINAQRAANGLLPYEPDDQLNQVALEHAQDMVRRQYVSHNTPEGLTVRDRIEAGGINDAFRVGENIQVNTKPRERTVQEALGWFMSSSPHRRGILHQNYNRIGIGIVNGPPEWHTFVLVFAER